MGLRINTNIEAMNALRHLGATASAFSKSVEKLSSGLRINRAADDAAGLAISQRLEAQVKGLDQAQRNTQDGISLVQTAEGALNESQSILQRMRELVLQAGTATVSGSDKVAIEQQIVSLKSELDRIANSTEYNGIKLLDGSVGSAAIATGMNAIAGVLPNGATTRIHAGSLAQGAYTLTTTTSSSSGSGSTIGGSSGLGTPANPAGFGTTTAIDDAVNGLYTRTGSQGNTVAGITSLGAGLNSVTTFNAGTLNADTYSFAVTSAGAAATINDANNSATVTAGTAIDSTTAGLATTTASGPTAFATPTAANFYGAMIGNNLGTMVNQALNTGGTLAAGQWTLHSFSPAGTVAKNAVWTLQKGGTVINLTNTGGVLTDAASGFRIDLSGLTGTIGSTFTNPNDVGIVMTLKQNVGVDTTTAANDTITLTDAFGGTSVIALAGGETFQQVADAINAAAGTAGHARLAAAVGAHGLVIANSGASANSGNKISVAGTANALTGLGFLAPGASSTSGPNNVNNTSYTSGTTPATATGAAATASLTDLGSSGQPTISIITGVNNVFTDAATQFSLDLSGATGGALIGGRSAQLTVGAAAIGVDTSAGPGLMFADETGSHAGLTLLAGETFQQVIDAVNGLGLALHASFGSRGIELTSTGTNLAGSISVQGSDDALRGLGFNTADGTPASTSNTVTITGSAGVAASATGGPVSATLTSNGGGNAITLIENGGVYSDASSGFSVDFSNVPGGLSAGSAAIVIAGGAANLLVGANGTASEMIAINISDNHAARLGVDTVDVTGGGFNSDTTIQAIDAAINAVSNTRAGLGAVQNRLEHTIASLGVASENMSASESRIKDLDVASEMVKFTKTQILQQAGTAILAQANSAPQNILALLR